jgi:hypothetical protein
MILAIEIEANLNRSVGLAKFNCHRAWNVPVAYLGEFPRGETLYSCP